MISQKWEWEIFVCRLIVTPAISKKKDLLLPVYFGF